MPILWGVKFTVSQGFPLTKLMAVNTGLAPPAIDKLQFLSFIFAVLLSVTAHFST